MHIELPDLFAIVDIHAVVAVLHQGRLSFQRQLVRRSALHLTDRLGFTADVCVTVKGQGYLLSVTRLKCAVQRQNVKDLRKKVQ